MVVMKEKSDEPETKQCYSLFPKVNSFAMEGTNFTFISPSVKDGIAIAVLQKNEIVKTIKEYEHAVLYECGKDP